MEMENFYAYCLTDWEGYFAENPRDRIDFVCTEKVFESYQDAYLDAEQRLSNRMSEYRQKHDECPICQDYRDVALADIKEIKPNEECYLKKLFNDDNEELCTLQITKYEYVRKKS